MDRRLDAHIPGQVNNAMIKANAKAFQVLSSNLYTNKPLAIIRELCANALDAHIAAGNSAPFDVFMPTRLRPELRIKDYGTGLSHEQMLVLYVTFFGSDKNNSNDLIGGLGLGSKTPLSYVDAFTVITRYNGTRGTYTIFKDTDGMPKITLVEEVHSDDPNGLEVIVPVKGSDYSAFNEAAAHALRYFESHTFVLRGCDTPIRHPQYDMRTEKFGVRRDDNWGPQVVMGALAYPIAWSALPAEVVSTLGVLRTSARHFDLFVDIGEIDIQASREALSYDRRSIEVLVRKLKELHGSYLQEMEQAIRAEPTLLRRAQKAAKLRRDWKTNDFERYINDATCEIRSDETYGVPIDWQTRNPNYHYPNVFSAEAISGTPLFIYLDEAAGRSPPIRKFLRDNKEWLKGKSIRVVGNPKLRQKLERICGPHNWVNFSDVYIATKPQRKKGAQPRRKIGGALLTLTKHSVFGVTARSRYYWRDRTVADVNELNPAKAAYVHVENYGISDSIKCEAYTAAYQLGLLDDLEIIGIPRAEKHMDEPVARRLDHLSLALYKRIYNAYRDPKFVARMKIAHLQSEILPAHYETPFRRNRLFFERLAVHFPDSLLIAVHEAFKELPLPGGSYEKYRTLFGQYPQTFKVLHRADTNDYPFFALLTLAKQKYPMFAHMLEAERHSFSCDADTFFHYLKLVESQK